MATARRLKLKHPLVLSLVFLLSWYIYTVNRSWGNSVEVCLVLSTHTFAMVSLGFFCVWEIRDFWMRRWEEVHARGVPRGGRLVSSCEQIRSTALEIPLRDGTCAGSHLRGTLIEDARAPPGAGPGAGKEHRPLVVLCHGYSDTQDDVAHLAYALALAGYSVVTYDARGHGLSRGLGSKNELVSKYHGDFAAVVNYIFSELEFDHERLYAAGASMGGSTVLIGGLADGRVRKIAALATIANYGENMPRVPVPFSTAFWLKLRYALHGLPMHPPPGVDRLLSPAASLKNVKGTFTPNEWASFTRSRLLLGACRNDKVIRVGQMFENASVAELPSENVFLFERGGHTFLRRETLQLGAMLGFFARGGEEGASSK
ncbi:MAG: alpha/beta hydrolase family protein [Promethearchaeota archaeon]